MTAQITTTNADRPFLARLAAGFVSLVSSLSEASHAARCGREAQRLLAMSDQELARRGLTRDTVVQHAFRSYF